MSAEKQDDAIQHPTFLEHIRYFFDPVDIDHMRRVGEMDLASYDGIKSKATQIYFQTASGRMPPEPERRWSQGRVDTFRNWIVDNYPMGESPVDRLVSTFEGMIGTQPLTRRNAAHLSDMEVGRLAMAFETIMQRDPTHPQSYYAVAGIHWFPEPFFCVHHDPRYNSWHRVYVDRFENALRSVPGCEDITLPYWDILAPIPDWLFAPPFDSYVLQAEAGPAYPAGHRTTRNPADQIAENLSRYPVSASIHEAMNSPQWESFTWWIERAHDNGHISCGGSMRTPDIASFDPLFWFFHCNWERLWWAWQKRYHADTLSGFRATLGEPEQGFWIDTPPFNELTPFSETADQTIDSTGYHYEEVGSELFDGMAAVVSGSVPIDRGFRLAPEPRLSIRVKGIARLKIEGSFVVHLLADGEEAARSAFFQGHAPERCVSCVEREKVDIDLIANRDAIAGKDLEIRIETLAPDRIDRWVPLSRLGSPTISVRELLTSR